MNPAGRTGFDVVLGVGEPLTLTGIGRGANDELRRGTGTNTEPSAFLGLTGSRGNGFGV